MIFDLVNNVPQITIEGLHIPEFTAIWAEDDREDKARASGALAYVYHVGSPKSLYSKYSPEERVKTAYNDYIVEEWFPEELIQAAIDKLIKLEETPEMRFLKSVEYALQKLEEYNYSIDFNALDDRGKPIYSVRDVVSTVKEAGKLFESIEALKQTINKLKEQKRNIRKDITPSSVLHD